MAPSLIPQKSPSCSRTPPSSIQAFVEQGNNAVIQRVYALSAGLIVNKHLPLHIAYEEEYTAVMQDATYLKPGSYVPMTPFKMNACHFLGGLLQCLRLR